MWPLASVCHIWIKGVGAEHHSFMRLVAASTGHVGAHEIAHASLRIDWYLARSQDRAEPRTLPGLRAGDLHRNPREALVSLWEPLSSRKGGPVRTWALPGSLSQKRCSPWTKKYTESVPGHGHCPLDVTTSTSRGNGGRDRAGLGGSPGMGAPDKRLPCGPGYNPLPHNAGK